MAVSQTATFGDVDDTIDQNNANDNNSNTIVDDDYDGEDDYNENEQQDVYDEHEEHKDEDEWQISFMYDPMEDFVSMRPAQNEHDEAAENELEPIPFNVNELKLVKNNRQYVVSGYIRNVELLLKNNANWYSAIPDIIYWYILYYYHHMTLRFDEMKIKLQGKLSVRLSVGELVTRGILHDDLGDMHVIPHDYLDNILEAAVANYNTREERIDHVQRRLQKKLPETVAHILAETLVTSIQSDYYDGDDYDDDDDEWQINFVYEPMDNFVPMSTKEQNEPDVVNTDLNINNNTDNKNEVVVSGYCRLSIRSNENILPLIIQLVLTYLHFSTPQENELMLVD